MTYVDGFVIPMKSTDKQAFLDHARRADQLLINEGALRIVECWAEDVPHGKQTDFYRSVAAAEDETVCFSWIEWPDKATRDAAFAKMMDDEQLMSIPVPFDGKRMIFGGFEPILTLEKNDG